MFIDKSPDKAPDPGALSKSVKRFEWLTGFLICRFHFVHRVLGAMFKTPAPGMGTLGVRVIDAGHIELSYDPAVFNALTDAEATYILYHEILHVVLHHCTLRKPSQHDELWAVAIDLAANELIPESPDVCMRPRDKDGKLCGCFVDEFAKKPEYKDIKAKQTAEWYFEFLKARTPKITLNIIMPGQKGKGGQQGQGKDDPQKGSGKNQMTVQLMDNHDGHKESEVADERIRALIRDVDRNNIWGNMDGTDKEVILAAQVKRINWRNLIRSWWGQVASKAKEGTRKRPNKRMGWMFPGSRRRYEDRGLIAWDDSGSVDSELLAEFGGVTNQLAEDYPIDWMTFDHKMQDGPVTYDRRRVKFEVHGRGGTNFQPVMDIVEKNRYRWVMIMTDGQANAPTRPAGADVIWVLPKGCNPPVDWGTVVHMEKRA